VTAAAPAATPRGSGLGARLLSAVVGIPLLLGVIIVGGPIYTLVVAAALGVGYHELVRALRLQRTPLTLCGYGAVILLPWAASLDPAAVPAVLVAGVLASLVALVARGEAPESLAPWALTLAGVLYVGLLGQHFVSLRGLEDGRAWVLTAIAITFAADTGAYATGRLLGRHKLAPRLSPSKTVEGLAGGLLAGAAAAAACAALLDPGPSPALMAALGLVAAAAAAAGDLAESALKRTTGVKDMGRIVPGHGGILDRLDSLLFVVPLVYYAALTS